MSIADFYLAAPGAAEVLGVHPETIKRLCQRGRIRAEKVHNTWLIPKGKFEEFSLTYRKGGQASAVPVSPVSRPNEAEVRSPGTGPRNRGLKVSPLADGGTGTDAFTDCPLFRDFATEELLEIRRVAQGRRLKPGQVLFVEGDPVDFCYVVASGLLKLLTHSARGKDSIVGIYGRAETVGFTRLFDPKPLYYTSAKAVLDTELIALNRRDFASFLHGHPELGVRVLAAILDVAMKRRRVAGVRLSEHATEATGLRLARVLFALASKLGDIIPLSRSEIAEIAGTATETASRFISRLSRKGVLESFRRKVVVVERQKLLQLAGAASAGIEI